MNKSLSVLIYALVWVVLVLIQSLLLSGNGANVAFWQQPSRYYSVWFVDLYLIILFYANYYGFAVSFIRRRMFKQYVWLAVLAAVIGLLLPVIFYHAFHWTLPGTAPEAVPFSSLGAVGAIAVMAIGLAVRGVGEWVKLEAANKELKDEIQTLQKKLAGTGTSAVTAKPERNDEDGKTPIAPLETPDQNKQRTGMFGKLNDDTPL
ncbi:hypothetical protein [Porphyromonas macacae]|uniref:hypothetical protein n=1 Tax=Porphyromonas macacae TaxID=28115 RepID=UPI0035A03805